MNEIWLLPMWNLELYELIVCPNMDFNKKFAQDVRGLKKFDVIFASKLSSRAHIAFVLHQNIEH